MDFTNQSTETLVKLWDNLQKGLTEVHKTIENKTFTIPKDKGGAPPSQAGQLTLWFALAVDTELRRRGVH